MDRTTMSTRLPLALVGLLATLGPWVAGCGATEATQVATTPFLEEHESMFENGLDMVRDPEALGGSWHGTWIDELDERVTHADVVALVTVRTLRTDVDLERNETFRLIASVDRTFLGEIEDEVTLRSSSNEAGYGTIENNQRRLLDQRFIAYIKWQDTDDGRRARWHLSPATEPVAVETRRLLSSRRQVATHGTRRTVIVHRH